MGDVRQPKTLKFIGWFICNKIPDVIMLVFIGIQNVN